MEKPSSLPPQNDSLTDDRIPLMRGRSHSMLLVEAILGRRSIRRFDQKEISKDILDRILEAGRQAPSAANRQPWHFIVLTDDRIKRRLSKWLFTKHIKNSPVTIVGCANTGLLDRKWSTIGTSIALQNMVIAAWAMGVGSCWIGGFKESEVKKLLSIPDKWKVVALVSFGYPSEKPHAKRRKPIEKIVGYNKF
ncbi:MAG: nitroreductase family protein [Candidatus Bathyarchaeota archaeon]|nr:nitroreductase family protein [Candidatus Bathyarchaeota archaeon]